MHRSSPNAQQTSNAHFQGFTASPEHVNNHPDNRPTWHAKVTQAKQLSPMGMNRSSQNGGRKKKHEKQIRIKMAKQKHSCCLLNKKKPSRAWIPTGSNTLLPICSTGLPAPQDRSLSPRHGKCVGGGP
jgi:hypothetical protein